MVATRLLSADQMAAWVSHGCIVPMTQHSRIQKTSLDQVGKILNQSWEIS
jgi:hypothetical protein